MICWRDSPSIWPARGQNSDRHARTARCAHSGDRAVPVGPLSRVSALAQRRIFGQYFTPAGMVRFVFDLLNPQPHETVIDPCCGQGVFLAEGVRRGVALVVGLERDRRALNLCRGALRRVCRQATLRANRATRVRLVHQDGLREIAAPGVPPREYDLVVGNPPFNSGRYRDPHAEAACRRYARVLPSLSNVRPSGTRTTRGTGLGNWEIEAAFLLRFLDLARPGGRVAIVLPTGLLANWKLRALRAALTQDVTIDAVIELPPGAFRQSGTQVRTAVLIVRRTPPQSGCVTLLAQPRHAAHLDLLRILAETTPHPASGLASGQATSPPPAS